MKQRADYQYMNFYPDDYIGDLNLKRCSLAAIGLWSFLLCLMHKGNPYGHLTTEAGSPIERDLWKYVPVHPDEIAPLMAELEENNVFSRTTDLLKVPYSRRMVKDHKVRMRRREGGQLGGNPALLFDPWWKLYPVKKGKGAAQKAFVKALKVVDIQRLTEGVEKLNKAVADGIQDPDYIPHPTTWLNQGRWDDEFKQKRGKGMKLEQDGKW